MPQDTMNKTRFRVHQNHGVISDGGGMPPINADIFHEAARKACERLDKRIAEKVKFIPRVVKE